jgi:hypothetical protein
VDLVFVKHGATKDAAEAGKPRAIRQIEPQIGELDVAIERVRQLDVFGQLRGADLDQPAARRAVARPGNASAVMVSICSGFIVVPFRDTPS